MSSLRDQLLKTGFVSKEQAKKAEKQAKSQTHQQQKLKKKKKKAEKTEVGAVETESAAYLAAKAREEEIAHAQELNRQKEAERQQKELHAQVRDLIQSHQVNDSKADIAYHFSEGKFIRRISVNAQQQQQLTNGQLAITVWEDSYYLVPTSIAEKLLERAPETVLYLNKDEEKTTEADDLYADYVVPDDLMW
ncbi:MAG TPA: DUF2058 domain-containing protein [Thioploca sp.]|nr:MAG: DUF2058 domain-containing protein [Gammaproteobacteria bacterium]HDN27449.1 DUF2058 domain-containing protein [Thioploca sp.]